ncbi:MAG: GNAT family N-acetyltransferase [Myxococcota bacterium]
MHADWLIEPFHRSCHDRADFSCGNKALDDYLHKHASPAQRSRSAAIFVIHHPADPIVRGYYSLSNTTIHPADLPEDLKRRFRVTPVPATLLGRMAVDSRFQGKGLGKKLLYNALARAAKLSADSGSMAVVVNAIDSDARRFYLERSFIELQDDPNHLFIPMATIRALDLPDVPMASSQPRDG